MQSEFTADTSDTGGGFPLSIGPATTALGPPNINTAISVFACVYSVGLCVWRKEKKTVSPQLHSGFWPKWN